MKKALIVVDYQYDFVDPNGSLYVKDGEKLQKPLLALINEYKNNNDLVIATKDWHPAHHCSFEIWPPHCIQNTKGSELYNLAESSFDKIILKGTKLNADSYSGFFDDDHTSNGLDEYLKANDVTELCIVGVALDVCVSATLVDAIKLGYHGYVDLNLCVGIDNHIKF
ncbi:isochorismatase family protein [Spiroplasma eriocheiris]|uniref:nicotinamidase n=1 Tax=Spiroplasma eriocheiris TaxID=315358 RepID=A0A0H3XJ37_9MOLU|nr:isochorismatase family protein [Spiroplasma eriocheiris]AHF57354.1 putative pyrazinamidase/nicotinamidase [Spiroplasma eriocheiris CCTCC M 207170]AKM53811.1 pyrazinamidase/nicotinamidase [Spiroplasma eriocheiris]